MPWVKLSDTFAEDPRLEEAGPLALALHVAALCYCARQLTNGHVTRSVVRRLLELDDSQAVAGRLVDVAMWEPTQDGYLLTEYLEDQPSREQVEALRAKRAAAGRTGGQRSGATRRSNSEATTKQVASRLVEPRPAPTRPPPPPPTPSLADGLAETSPPAPPEASKQEEEGFDENKQDAPRPLPADALVAVVLERLPGSLRSALEADPRSLVAACANLAASGWTLDDLEHLTTRRNWHGAGAGAVIHWARGLETTPRPSPRRLRPSNSNRCPSGHLYGADGTCCPEHDRDAQEAAS